MICHRLIALYKSSFIKGNCDEESDDTSAFFLLKINNVLNYIK